MQHLTSSGKGVYPYVIALLAPALMGLIAVGPATAGPESVNGPAGDATAAATSAASPSSTIKATIVAEPYHLAKTADGQKLSVDGFGRLLVPGKPVLPSKIFALAIPPGAELVQVDFDAGPGQVLPGVYQISPAPLPRVIGQEDPFLYEESKLRYQRNYDSVYGADDPYPAQVVEMVGTPGYRKYDLVDVRLTPFVYQPLSGRLTYHREITVFLTYQFPEGRSVGIADHLARTERTAEKIIFNYGESQSWYPSPAVAGRGLHDFVIVTLDSLLSSVAPLADWEGDKGRNVEVVTTSWIDSNYTGYDLAERIRNFLRDKYPSEEWGIEDVLLVGHYDDVPMRRTAQDLGYGAPETDFYYAELSEPDSTSWDSDGDHQYGENSDPIDFYAEVNVGRIPWSDPATVLSICQKSVAYEQNDDPAFKKNMLLMGAYFWADTDNAELMEAKVDQPWMTDWTITRMYEKNSGYWSSYECDYPLLNSNVMSVWPIGKYAFVNWAGHGSPTSCHIYGLGAPAFISSSDCPSLDDDYPAIIFADACSNSDTDSLNIGQAMLEQGAVGFVGATKVALGQHGWDDPLDGSSQSLDYYFTTCVTSGEYTQGEALQWALQEMYTNGSWDYNKYETFEWGALWGNPGLRMSPPPVLKVSFPDGLPEYLEPGVPSTLTVKVSNGVEDYVAGTGTLHYRYDGGTFLTVPLVAQGGDLYDATFPAPEENATPEFYISAQGDGGTTVSNPSNAPDTVYTAIVGLYTGVMVENFDSDPGWTTEGLWAFGQPTGGGGDHGGPDPTSGHTGNNVYGYNLNGDYENYLSERHLTSTPLDCSTKSNVTLKFWRWLGVEQPMYDHAYVRVSNDGTNWTTVWSNSSEIEDASWSQREYDISSVADGEPTVYLRWTMGSTDTSWQYCGWNIDDVEIWALVSNVDCNDNGNPDNQDIAGGTSEDCNNNQIPDECEIDENSPAPGGPYFCTGNCDPDCNENGTPDECDIDSGAAGDCNDNGVPDGCDVDEGTSPDCNVNDIPDECDISEGTSADKNNNDIPDECDASAPLVAPAPHDVRKNRYLSFAPDVDRISVAFQVELVASAYFPDSVGVLGWVGEPDGEGLARIVDEAFFTDSWPALVQLGACQVVPVAAYEIRASANGRMFSAPLELHTIAQPGAKLWGDVVGDSGDRGWTGPDGIVNMDDVMAGVQRFQQLPEAPPLTWVDLDGEVPNSVFNMTDLLRIVQGFKGEPYPFSDPASCP